MSGTKQKGLLSTPDRNNKSKIAFPTLVPSENNSNSSPAYLTKNNLNAEANNLAEMLSSPSLRRHSFSNHAITDLKLGKEIPKWILYTLLLSTTTICFGNYYVYDFPQALQTPFNDILHIGPKATNLFYSAYGLPNTV